MAILRGFPSSSTIYPGPKIALECEDCRITAHGVYGRNKYGGHEPPSLPDRWVTLCQRCADIRAGKVDPKPDFKEGF